MSAPSPRATPDCCDNSALLGPSQRPPDLVVRRPLRILLPCTRSIVRCAPRVKMEQGAYRAAMYDSLTPSDCRANLRDLVPMIRDDLRMALGRALERAALPEPPRGIGLDPARSRDHGDWASNVALQLKSVVDAPPREIAERIKSALEAEGVAHLAKVEIAGPGFLNLFLAPSWLHDVVRDVVGAGAAYGRSDVLHGRRINLEFVSANPTGPLHAGGGRWVAVGDAIANLLAAQGAEVHREYYLNDAGAQLDYFRDSLYARYRGEDPPEDGYHGQYLVEMAAQLHADLGDDVTPEAACEWGYGQVVASLHDDLARVGVHFDTWFSERTLHERGEVADVLAQLTEKGFVYDSDGARWFRSTDFGDQRDRVLVRSDGTTTYLCNDFAYHRDKFARGFTHLIDIWGADHHGQVKSLQAGMEALGFEHGEPEIILGQFVKVMKDGREVRMSKRTGNIVALADILDEVDPDVARMTFLLQGIDTAQTIDLDVVTEQSRENPVYYVQYAHARIASIGRKAEAAGVAREPLAGVDLSLLVHEREDELMRALANYPDALHEAAEVRAPQKVSTWVRDFASEFHGFYRDCKVLSDDPELTQARLWLTEACAIGLANALAVLGVNAPDEMTRLERDDEDDEFPPHLSAGKE
ncbi:MAG TPA: arginine--tRNA ligase [Acidimicrobiia bacterium]|nr:arginine--tRNA ligase [Acidimicrobiia bacterium]